MWQRSTPPVGHRGLLDKCIDTKLLKRWMLLLFVYSVEVCIISTSQCSALTQSVLPQRQDDLRMFGVNTSLLIWDTFGLCYQRLTQFISFMLFNLLNKMWFCRDTINALNRSGCWRCEMILYFIISLGNWLFCGIHCVLWLLGCFAQDVLPLKKK